MRKFAWWQVVVTAAVGGFGVGMILSAVVAIVVAVVRMMSHGSVDLSDPELPNRLVAETQTLPVVATSLVITALGFGGSPFIAAKLRKVDAREALGLRKRAPLAAFLAAPIGILALGPLSDVLVQLARWLLPNATFGALEQINALARSHSPLVLIPFLAICPGFGEELLFRGFVQRSIGRGRLAITVSALTFAAIHVDPHHVIGVIPLGFFLAWTAARTDSTWVTITAHVANNTMAVLTLTLMPDQAGDHAGPLAVAIGLGVFALCVAAIAKVCPTLPDVDPVVTPDVIRTFD